MHKEFDGMAVNAAISYLTSPNPSLWGNEARLVVKFAQKIPPSNLNYTRILTTGTNDSEGFTGYVQGIGTVEHKERVDNSTIVSESGLACVRIGNYKVTRHSFEAHKQGFVTMWHYQHDILWENTLSPEKQIRFCLHYTEELAPYLLTVPLFRIARMNSIAKLIRLFPPLFKFWVEHLWKGKVLKIDVTYTNLQQYGSKVIASLDPHIKRGSLIIGNKLVPPE